MLKRTFVVVLFVVTATACGSPTQQKQNEGTERQDAQYDRVQPVPFFDWSQDRDTLVQIYKLKNEARQTWTVVTGWDGSPRWSCPSRGYPLAADSQLTNPLRKFPGYEVVIEQAEPNGIYSSKNTDATYVLCVRGNGDVTPVYTELKATAFPFAVRIDNGQIIDADPAAAATVSVQIGRR